MKQQVLKPHSHINIYEHSRCVYLKIYYIKETFHQIPIKMSPSLWTHSTHSPSLFLKQLRSPLSQRSLTVVSWNRHCSEFIQTISFHGHFGFREESEVTQCQIQQIRWISTQHGVFMSCFFSGRHWQEHSLHFWSHFIKTSGKCTCRAALESEDKPGHCVCSESEDGEWIKVSVPLTVTNS